MNLILISEIKSGILSFNKLIVSASYSIFAAGASIIAMLLFYHLNEIWKLKSAFLEILGKNALLLWIMQFIFVYYPMTYLIRNSRFMTLPRAATVSILFLMSFWLVVKILNIKKIRLRI